MPPKRKGSTKKGSEAKKGKKSTGKGAVAVAAVAPVVPPVPTWATLGLPGVVTSPFLLSQIKHDLQAKDWGSCWVISSIGLAHAQQALGNLNSDNTHSVKEVQAKLTAKNKKRAVTKGGVPAVAFRALLGEPAEISLSNAAAITFATGQLQQLGGVLPGVPAPVLRPAAAAAAGVAPPVCADVSKAALVAAWDALAPTSKDWHSLMIVGTIAMPTGEVKYLCRNSWASGSRWACIPMLNYSDVAANVDRLEVLVPSIVQMAKPASHYAIQTAPITLADSHALPKSYADQPRAYGF